MTDPTISDSLTDGPRDPAMRFRRAALLLLVAGISAIFLKMIASFLVAVLLAAIFAGMSYPFFRRLRVLFNGRENLASVVTILLLFLGVVVPLAGFMALVVSESVSLSQSVSAWLQSGPDRMQQFRTLAERIPFAERLIPESEDLIAKIGELAGRAGPILAGKAAGFASGTLNFLLQLFVCLYAMFFFLVDGPSILRTILYYIPLGANAEMQLLERFVSVTRATLKGSLLIGALQGTLAGLAFWVSGVPAPAFWGTVMVVLSIIPAIGAALIWVPAVIFLFATGNSTPAIGLLLWCAIVVSTIDNFLRPRLIGRDARMSDLLILLSTLGGIGVFGALGFIVGPIVAALFVTVWHIYGEAFREWLPVVPTGFLRAQVLATAGTAEERPPEEDNA